MSTEHELEVILNKAPSYEEFVASARDLSSEIPRFMKISNPLLLHFAEAVVMEETERLGLKCTLSCRSRQLGNRNDNLIPTLTLCHSRRPFVEKEIGRRLIRQDIFCAHLAHVVVVKMSPFIFRLGLCRLPRSRVRG